MTRLNDYAGFVFTERVIDGLRWTNPCACGGSMHVLSKVCLGIRVLSGDYIAKPRNRFVLWVVKLTNALERKRG